MSAGKVDEIDSQTHALSFSKANPNLSKISFPLSSLSRGMSTFIPVEFIEKRSDRIDLEEG